MTQKEALIVFPPQWCPYNPYPSVPTLLGGLKRAGFPARGLDLNVRFYRSLFTADYLRQAIRRAYDSKKAGLPDPERAEEICAGMEKTLAVFRDSAVFYQPDLLFRAKADLNDALEIISAPFAPSRLMVTDYFHGADLFEYDSIVSESENEDTNVFYSFLADAAQAIARDPAGYILVSVADITQILPTFTLCGLLKRITSKPICIGGNIITKLKTGFLSEPRFFNRFTDYFACGPGEISTVAFAEYMNGLRRAASVPGLIYRSADGSIASNPESSAAFSDYTLPDYTGLDFSQYLSPAPDCSIQMSRGCYWGKCAFCDVSFNREKYAQKPVEIAIREISHLVSLGINYIHLGDSSVSPAYFEQLCDAILQKDLKVYIFAFARLEKAFTPVLFNKMYRAGVRLIFWGYESESPRIMALINKGIDEAGRLKILRMSAEAGIWNHVSFMMGFPGESKEEALQTLDVIRQNRDILDSCFLARFSFKANAKIHEETQKYSLSQVRKKGSLSTECAYTAGGMTREELREISMDFRRRYIRENKDTLWPMVCDDLEHLLFYLARYGREGVRSMRLKDASLAERLYKKFL